MSHPENVTFPKENVTSICHQITMEKYKLVTKKCLEIELANTATLVKLFHIKIIYIKTKYIYEAI